MLRLRQSGSDHKPEGSPLTLAYYRLGGENRKGFPRGCFNELTAGQKPSLLPSSAQTSRLTYSTLRTSVLAWSDPAKALGDCVS